jgi:NAD(P)-dependent dehydrogenase (short-subunit alcohol dehydrogenase family)
VQNNVASRAIKREATPEDLCGTLLYLCSADSDFVTGQVLIVDGGSVMH